MKFRLELPDELKFITNSRKPVKASSERLDGKLCLITGATSGVGYEVAKRLSEFGCRIVMIARNPEKAAKTCSELEKISGLKAEHLIADFSKLEEVSRAAETVLSRYPKIDILINNAGVHMTHRTLTSEGHETAFCVNHLASFMITYILLERMKESAPSKIIQVNSEGHRFNGLRLNDLAWAKRRYFGLQGYGAAKTAQLLTMWEFNDMLKGSGVTINAMHPGAVKTMIGENNGGLYRFYLHNMVWPFLKDPKISGQAVHYLASHPEIADITGKFFNLTHEEIPAPHATDRAKGKEVFRISLGLTKLDNG